ncbi:hypothetical protein C483_11878 [Natrialba hulunbeirensis JCM 10989]|uniref:GH16 domain-containing protein n=1 Tax=Natrialba hulunbeirensis JCM 10989 TaxID=1227493 RepID=L9ZVV5_9EURY|nr:hypothetical protein [Natrialba hulunbeirensis]ELY90206.1 hypothetical protein C483_11878 [Natrialba hulunbeirensis JCM 10989]
MTSHATDDAIDGGTTNSDDGRDRCTASRTDTGRNSSTPPVAGNLNQNQNQNQNQSPSLSRRQTIRASGVLGALGLGGLVGGLEFGTGVGTAQTPDTTQCGRPDEVVHLDYDDYEGWDDVYRLSNGDPAALDLVADPTASGNRALQVRMQEGAHWGASTHYDFADGLFELTGRVRFALDTGWEMTGRYPANCRLWNCAMALGEGSAGGGMPDGTNGWSNRLYITNRGSDPDGPFSLLSHTYHMDQNQDHDFVMEGEPYALGQPEIVPGNWYEFEYYACVNTVTDGAANPDGIVRYWLDDDLVYEREDLRFTTDHANNIIDSNGPAGHYGGQYTAPKNLYAYYDDHSMALNGTFEFGPC